MRFYAISPLQIPVERSVIICIYVQFLTDSGIILVTLYLFDITGRGLLLCCSW